jgi:hypothetical protein
MYFVIVPAVGMIVVASVSEGTPEPFAPRAK